MVFSYIKSKSKPILFYASSASFRAERVSLGLLQNLTSKFKPQWPQSLLLSRTNFTRFYYHSNGNLPRQTSSTSTSTTHGEGFNLNVLLRMCLLFMIRLERIPYTERLHFTPSTRCEKKFSKMEKWENFEKERIGSSAHKEGNYRQKRRWKPAFEHLDGKAWEIYVADKDDDINAFCSLDGKIVIYSGLLNHLESDEEIATAIGHEMGHAVARHVSESISRRLGLRMPIVFLSDNFSNRRMEVEADYIGLMLMASAGYDPQIAPNLYQNRLGSSGSFESTHPPGKLRAKLSKEPKTMELAKQVYEDVKDENPITSFV